jgi:hypothetical protein
MTGRWPNWKDDEEMKPHQRMSKYLRGIADVLRILANETDADEAFTAESQELLSNIGANLLFNAKIYDFLNIPRRVENDPK